MSIIYIVGGIVLAISSTRGLRASRLGTAQYFGLWISLFFHGICRRRSSSWGFEVTNGSTLTYSFLLFLQHLVYTVSNTSSIQCYCQLGHHIYHLCPATMITMLGWFASTCLRLDVVPPDLSLVILDLVVFSKYLGLTYARDLFTVYVVATCIYFPVVRHWMVSGGFCCTVWGLLWHCRPLSLLIWC